jgi:hypothetical protein
MQNQLVWHLHGDYTNPEMLNTPDELREYDPAVSERLTELFDQYGLLIVGWSGTWDPALRAVLEASPSRHYPTYWLDRSQLSEQAAKLASNRHATAVTASADDWLPALAESCTAIRDRQRDPLTTLAAVAAAKRDFSAKRVPISTHDLLINEGERLRGLPQYDTNTYSPRNVTQWNRELADEHELWMSLVATLAYWGDDNTDLWWTNALEYFGSLPSHDTASSATRTWLATPAVLALYVGGVAATARHRWSLVTALLNTPIVDEPNSKDPLPVASLWGPTAVFPFDGNTWASREMYHLIRTPLADVLGLGEAVTQKSWEQFIYLHAITQQHRLVRKLKTRTHRAFPYLMVDNNPQMDDRIVADVRRSFDIDTSSGEALVRELTTSGIFGPHKRDRDISLEGQREMDIAQFSSAQKVVDDTIHEQIHAVELQRMNIGYGRRYPFYP